MVHKWRLIGLIIFKMCTKDKISFLQIECEKHSYPTTTWFAAHWPLAPNSQLGINRWQISNYHKHKKYLKHKMRNLIQIKKLTTSFQDAVPHHIFRADAITTITGPNSFLCSHICLSFFMVETCSCLCFLIVTITPLTPIIPSHAWCGN